MKLTETILGYNSDDLVDILNDIVSDSDLANISYLRVGSESSSDAAMLTAVCTYSREWQARYLRKHYLTIDPVVSFGRTAILPFDWDMFASDDWVIREFFADAVRHGVGRNGLSIPVRSRETVCSLVSFTSELSKREWESFKRYNMTKLQQVSALINSAASRDSKVHPGEVQLSRREEQCLIWAARGKTQQEIAVILSLSVGSVKSHLDTARHKLHCINLTHAVGVALQRGVIPATALRQSTDRAW
jgi:DNA-binding CsgD family transcriptional regulator